LVTTAILKSDSPVNVAARPCEARNEARPNRVGGVPDDDRDNTGGILGRLGRGCADHDQDIDSTTDQFAGKMGQALISPVSKAIVDNDAFPIHIS
jgi:hypothetical protein